MPAKELVRAQPICATKKINADARKTGRRPLISDSGARNIGEIEKPVAQAVTPVLNATSDSPHFPRSGPDAIEYEPALYAAQNVEAQERKRTMFLRCEDQLKGESSFARLGRCTPEASKAVNIDDGSSVWNVKYS